MPKFKYHCSDCNQKKEIEDKPDHETPECDECGEEMNRDFMAEGPPGIQFKGEGFHSTDYD